MGLQTSQTVIPKIGPQNITRAEGEVNVYIPCSLTESDNPIWKINNTYYEVYNLPRKFIPASLGLLITRVEIEMNGTTFQCIELGGSVSSVGILIVEEEQSK